MKELMNSQERPSRHPLGVKCILILFALSGAAGLMYEVVWVRQLTLVLGASTYAVTIILAAFMSGLGLGSWFFGKLADAMDEDRLARCLVFLEVGVGCYALVLPWLSALQQFVYVEIHHFFQPSEPAANAIRLVFAFVMLLFPTILMGGSLPVLSRYVTGARARASVSVSRLYAANTFGAVCGTIGAGYFLLPLLGNALTNLVAVGLNVIVGAGLWAVHRSWAGADAAAPAHADRQAEQSPWPCAIQTAVVAAYTLSGAATMFYQIAWTRTLTMVLGTTTFAFTTMLATFLLGLALGSALYSAVRRYIAPPRLFVLLQTTVGLTALLTVPLFAWLPFFYLSLHQSVGGGWAELQLIRFCLAMLVMILPTLAMGALLPAVTELLIVRNDVLGSRLGRAYGFNTFGSVLGAVLAGLVILPLIGMQNTIVLGACVNVIAGLMVVLSRADVSAARRLATVACSVFVFALLAGVMRPWSPKIMSSGVYAYASRYHDLIDRVDAAGEEVPAELKTTQWKLWQLAMDQYSLLYYGAGPTCTVSVMERDDGVRFLTVDGKTDASSAADHDMKTQVLLGQLPLLFHKAPDEVFVVGLGSGVTVGSILTHSVRLVDCAEFSPRVIEASRYFSDVNNRALDDERLRVIESDARNVLLTCKNTYDVIISQPSNPWISGQSSLFSLEWYQVVRRRLNDGGLFAQWVPAYCMSEDDVKVIIHTLRSEFPHVTAWTSGASGELILLASKDSELSINYEQFRGRVTRAEVDQDIRRLGYQSPELLPFLTFAMSERDVSIYLYSDLHQPLRKNTDNLLVTEFSTPKQLAEQHVVERFASAKTLRGDLHALVSMMADVDSMEAVNNIIGATLAQ